MSFMKAVAVVLLLTAQACDAQSSNSSSDDVVVDVNTWYDTFEQGPPFVVTSFVGILDITGSARFQTTLRVAAGGPAFPEGPQGAPSNTSAWNFDASTFDFKGQNWVGFALPYVDHLFPISVSCTPDKNDVCEGILPLRSGNTKVDLPWAQGLDLSLPIDLYIQINVSSPVEILLPFFGGPDPGVLVVPLNAPQNASFFGFGSEVGWGINFPLVSTRGVRVDVIFAVRPTLRWTFSNTNDAKAQPLSGAVAVEIPRMTLESRRRLKPNTQCAGGTSSDANKIYSNRSFSVINLADRNQGDIIASQLHMLLPTVCDTPQGSSLYTPAETQNASY